MLAADEHAQAAAHADRGLEFARDGNLPMAESELRLAVEMQPRDAQFLSTFGTVLAMELEESITVLTKALATTLVPDRAPISCGQLWQLHRYDAAKASDSSQTKLAIPHPIISGMVAENTEDYSTAVTMLASIPEQWRQQPQSPVARLVYYHLGQKQMRGRLWTSCRLIPPDRKPFSSALRSRTK